MVLIMITSYLFTLEVIKRQNFNLFWYTHALFGKFRAKRENNPNRKRSETHETLLARARRCAPPRARWTAIWLPCFVAHGMLQWLEASQGWMWTITPIVLYLFEKSGALERKTLHTTIIHAEVLEGPTAYLRITKPPGFKYLP